MTTTTPPPPRTAILISGHLRTFDLCLPTLRWHLFSKYPDADFFISTIKDKDSHKVAWAEDLAPRVEARHSQPDCVADIARQMGISTEELEGLSNHAPYAISVPPQAILAQLWQLQRCWEMIPDPSKYRTFIRCRPDLFMHRFEKPLDPHRFEAITPWWGRFGGVNDRLAVMGSAAAVGYFNTYSKTAELIHAGCPLHPESLVKSAVELKRCVAEPTLATEFSKYDESGKMVRCWVHETLPCDTPPRR